jgi:phospholipase/lecithinase/hemolysin
VAVQRFLHSIFQLSVFRTSKRRLTNVLIAGLTATAVGSSATAASFSQLVVFGDSLSDAGNDLQAIGAPLSPYYQGRFSNGPVWVDQLATMLGVPDPTASLAGGTNYAYGGAETGGGTSQVVPVPNVGTQIATYLQGHTPTASQLFVVDGGGNNIRIGETNPQVPVTDLVNEITALANAGAKSFLVPNLFLLGQTPEGLALPDGGIARNNLVPKCRRGSVGAKAQGGRGSCGREQGPAPRRQ